MTMLQSREKVAIVAVASVSIILNIYTFVLAYPQISILNSGCCASHVLAKDFSAYYTAAWRLVHDSMNVYTPGSVSDGGPQILPYPQSFKYLPSFLIFILPLTSIGYQNALVFFDCVQIALLPVIACLLFRLNVKKSLLTISLLMVVAILQPSPTPNWGFSISYFWQWEEGQDKVLLLTLLLCAYYFGLKRRPLLSGIMFALGSFDPRFLLLGFPLFLFFNKDSLKKGIASGVLSLIALNSFFLVPGVGAGFLSMMGRSGLETPLFYYAYIPFLTIIALMIVNWKELYQFYSSLLTGKTGQLTTAGTSQ